MKLNIATSLSNFDRWEDADLAKRQEKSGRRFDVLFTLAQQ